MARARPTEAATVAVAPPSGISPILVKASVRAADSVATTRSQASAADMPTPAAIPLRPHTTGLSSSVIARMIWLAASTDAGVVLLLGVLAAEVRAGGERATGAGEHDDPYVVTRRRAAQLLDRLDHHLAGQRVELLGPVQRQPQGAVLEPDLQVAHAMASTAVGASGMHAPHPRR